MSAESAVPLPRTVEPATAVPPPKAQRLAGLFFWLTVGGVLYAFVDQIGPRLLPPILKRNDASDSSIAFLIGTCTSIVALVVTPIVSYRSDRKRSRRGRRIPYLLWSVPAAAFLLAAIPFAEDLARWSDLPLLARFTGLSPTLLWFMFLSGGFHVFETIIGTSYFCLVRDVVPEDYLGRYLTLFRATTTCATFSISYWLVGLTEHNTKSIFLFVAVGSLVGFRAMTHFVREAPRLPLDAPARRSPNAKALAAAVQTFIRESFHHSIYWWTYLTRTLIYAAAPVTAFVIFFPTHELGTSLDRSGKLLSWASLSWIPIAYSWGKWMDRKGSIWALQVSLGGLALSNALSFLCIRGEASFVFFSMLNGALFWMALLAQTLLANQIFHRERMAQLAAANVIVQSIVIAGVVSPCAGWFLHRLRDYDATWRIPLLGPLAVGPYRFTFLMLAALFAVALFAITRVQRRWQAEGGPTAYRAPL